MTFAWHDRESSSEEPPASQIVLPSASQIVLPRGTRFEGLLLFDGTAQIDGELDGEVVSRGVLLVGETALVKARVQVGELLVAGRLEGDLNATERIELLDTARVYGVLRAPRIALAEGCIFHGQLRSGDTSR